MPDERYESTDALMGNVRRWGFVLAGFVVFGGALAMGFFYLFAPSPFRAAAELGTPRVPPGPLPQDNATTRLDIAALRAREADVLDHPGPSIVHPGARRIPIAEAMRQLAASGLPSRPGAPTPPPEPLPAGVLDHGTPPIPSPQGPR